MDTVDFTADQVMFLLQYLEETADAGYEINDVIEGIKDGSLTRNTNQSIPE